jgi:hypothetical protein
MPSPRIKNAGQRKSRNIGPVCLSLLASYSAMFFSHNKSVSASAAATETIRRTGQLYIRNPTTREQRGRKRREARSPVRRRGRRGRTPNCRREPAWPSPARPSCRARAVLPCKGLVERWWPMGWYSFQAGGDPRGSGSSGYSQPNRRCH